LVFVHFIFYDSIYYVDETPHLKSLESPCFLKRVSGSMLHLSAFLVGGNRGHLLSSRPNLLKCWN